MYNNDTTATAPSQYQKAASPEQSTKSSPSNSVHHNHFFRVYHWTYRYGLSFQAINLYATLYAWSDEDGISHAKQDTLANTLHLTERQIRRCVAELKAKGLIKVETFQYWSTEHKKRCRRNTYKVLDLGGLDEVYWSKVPVWLLNKDLSSGAVHVYALLEFFTSKKKHKGPLYGHWTACPTQDTIARTLHKSVRSVQDFLRELEGAGAIVRIRMREEFGEMNNNLYTLLWSDD